MHVEDRIWNILLKIGPVKLCSGLALVLYLNTLQADFVYDDSRAILKNPDLLQVTPLWNLFSNDFWGTPLLHSGSHKSYRPLCVLTFRLNHYVHGFNPFGYHLANVLLHAIVTALFVQSTRILLNACHTGCSNNKKVERDFKSVNNGLSKHYSKRISAEKGFKNKKCGNSIGSENGSLSSDRNYSHDGDATRYSSSLYCEKRDRCSTNINNGYNKEGGKCRDVGGYDKSCNGVDKSARFHCNGASLVNTFAAPNGQHRKLRDYLSPMDSPNNPMTDGQKNAVVMMSGLLFAAHPVHTEAVAGIVGRADVLSCLFFLLAFLSYISYCSIRDSRGKTNSNNGFQGNAVHYPSHHTDRQGPGNNKRTFHDESIELTPGLSTCVYGGNGTRGNGLGYHRAKYLVREEQGESRDESNYQQARWLGWDELEGRRLRWLPAMGCMVFTLAAMLCKEQGVTVVIACALYDLLICCHVTLNQLRILYKAQYRHLQEGLLLLTLTGATLLWWRFYVMGVKPPEFSPADNPASDSPHLLTRFLTFSYLPVLNLWLLICPQWLSFDWSMGSVPLIEHLYDYRNLSTIIFYFSASVLASRLLVSLDAYNNLHNFHLSKVCNNSQENGRRSAVNGFHKKNGHCNGNNGHHNGSPNSSYMYFSNNKSFNDCEFLEMIANSLGRTLGSALSRVCNIIPSEKRKNFSQNAEQTDLANGSFLNHSRSSGFDNSILGLTSRPEVDLLSSMSFPPGILLVALTFLVVPFLPATNLLFYVGFVIAERILYIPSMGFCLMVALGSHSLVTRFRGLRAWRLVHLLTFLLTLSAFCWRSIDRNRDWLSEESLYRSGVSVNPAKALGNLANVLNSKGRTREAEEAYRQALKHRGNMADVHYNLGILLQDQRRYEESLQSYQTAIRCRPQLTMAHLNLGIVFALIGRKQEAEEVYRKCSRMDTAGLKDPRLHEYTKISALYNLGRLLADQDRHEEAITVYHEALNKRPSHYQPQSLLNMLGESYSKMDSLDKAEFYYKEALKVKPDHIPAHLTLAKLYSRLGENEKAETLYQKVIKINPLEPNIYQHYGQFLAEAGRYSEAADIYLRASSLSPLDFEIVFNTANALRQAERNEAAEEFYRRSVALQPQVSLPHTNLGAMLHSNGKLLEAEQSYLRSLQLKPDDTITQINLNKLRSLIRKSKLSTTTK